MAYRVLLNLFLKQNSFRVPQILNCFSVLGLSKSVFDSIKEKHHYLYSHFLNGIIKNHSSKFILNCITYPEMIFHRNILNCIKLITKKTIA